MRHIAIYNLYPNVTDICDKNGSFDKDGNSVTIDEAKVAEEEAKLQTDYDLKSYARARQQNFPNEHDLLIALWEKVMEDRSESADALQAIRTQVKSDNPKP
tara:strand:+ start:487 stop:789 length:303 start_codon:yes stop_codon:yes gene_type:complete